MNFELHCVYVNFLYVSIWMGSIFQPNLAQYKVHKEIFGAFKQSNDHTHQKFISFVVQIPFCFSISLGCPPTPQLTCSIQRVSHFQSLHNSKWYRILFDFQVWRKKSFYIGSWNEFVCNRLMSRCEYLLICGVEFVYCIGLELKFQFDGVGPLLSV